MDAVLSKILYLKQNIEAIEDILIDYLFGRLSEENSKIVATFINKDPFIKSVYKDVTLFFDEDEAFKYELLHPEEAQHTMNMVESLLALLDHKIVSKRMETKDCKDKEQLDLLSPTG